MKKILLIITVLTLTGCFMRPYVPDVQQGNVVDKTDVAKVQTGMSKDQVRDLLGVPVLASPFDKDCWTYAYTMQKDGGKITKQTVTLYFDNNKVTQIKNNAK
jgi:outer membrane protein assembly factor BamE